MLLARASQEPPLADDPETAFGSENKLVGCGFGEADPTATQSLKPFSPPRTEAAEEAELTDWQKEEAADKEAKRG